MVPDPDSTPIQSIGALMIFTVTPASIWISVALMRRPFIV